MNAALPGIERHPHARAVLEPALPPGHPSHAYLFYGPAGVGKRALARAFAAALLADGAADPAGVSARVLRGSHPDLSWISPTGAAAMLVGDVDQAVVRAATLTPLESSRRVFVLDGADQLNEQAANRLLKTLEEPPPRVHLILISDRRDQVLATVGSRCQEVRFDPLSERELVELVLGEHAVSGEKAVACARLAGGNGVLARWLASGEGQRLRELALALLLDAARGGSEGGWLELLELAKRAADEAGERVGAAYDLRLEAAASAERAAITREREEAVHRAQRRARSQRLDLGLAVVEALVRDLLAVALRADQAVLCWDLGEELAELAQDLDGGSTAALERAVVAVAETRLRLGQHVSEQLALEGLHHRLQAALGGVSRSATPAGA